MLYVYECRDCLRQFEVVKAAANCDSKEDCPACGAFLSRVFTPPQISIKNQSFQPGLNPAFGRKFGTYREQQDHIRRLNDNGHNIQEVGTSEQEDSRPKSAEYDGQDAAEWLRSAAKNPGMLKDAD